jgi:hypothetical protein
MYYDITTDFYKEDYDPESVASRYLMLRALVHHFSGQEDICNSPNLNHTHVFQWMIGPGVTVIDVHDAWADEIGVLISDLAAEDRVPIKVDPTNEQLRSLLESGERLPSSELPGVSEERLRAMQEARVLVPFVTLEKRITSPIVIFTEDTECVDCYLSIGTWLACQSPIVQRLADLGIRVVIIGHGLSPVNHTALLQAVDRRLAIGGLLLNNWVFRKVMQTFFGAIVPDDARHGLPVGVDPAWLREHVTQLLQAQPRM